MPSPVGSTFTYEYLTENPHCRHGERAGDAPQPARVAQARDDGVDVVGHLHGHRHGR